MNITNEHILRLHELAVELAIQDGYTKDEIDLRPLLASQLFQYRAILVQLERISKEPYLAKWVAENIKGAAK